MAIKIYKISSWVLLYQRLLEDKFLRDHVLDISQHFCQTNKYNEIGWLLLIVLEKVGKEKDEFKDLNSQSEHHISDLEDPMSALTETFISCHHRDC